MKSDVFTNITPIILITKYPELQSLAIEGVVARLSLHSEKVGAGQARLYQEQDLLPIILNIDANTVTFEDGEEGGPIEFVMAVKNFDVSESMKWLNKEFRKKTEPEEEPIDLSQFEPMTSADLEKVLGHTIKNDNENKITTFLCMLSAYTEDAQFNISFNAPSSTGKSYIPMETAQLFPKDDLKQIGYCTPTAFFHDYGEWDKEKKHYTVDLSRKIIVFLDQPHTKLLERLRPLLSHDEKYMETKITDKSQKHGLRTKTVRIKGFPAVVFCSAGMRIDEQEGTRFFLLSPETNQEKIHLAILERIKKETDRSAYKKALEDDKERKLLMERIKAIKQAKIDDVLISNPDKIQEVFLNQRAILKPRHQRDIGRLMSLVKMFTLLNLPFRDRNGSVLVSTEEDLTEAVKIWDKISESQEHNVSPYVYQVFTDVIVSAFKEKKNPDTFGPETEIGISTKEMMKKYFSVYGRVLPDYQLRQEILPALETAGLIQLEQDPSDRRKKLIYPTTQLNISTEKNNNKPDGGVSFQLPF